MTFSASKSLKILERTPEVLIAMLRNLPEEWTLTNEGQDTWSAYDIIGHLIHGEKTDWIPRLEIMLSDNLDKSFQRFDRTAQFQNSKGLDLVQLLYEFRTLRKGNINNLLSRRLTDEDYQLKGHHPDFGEVTVAQLLSSWTVHDLNHIGQIARVMAKQYSQAVGPWFSYLKILQP